MTVQEFMHILAGHNPHMRVVVQGYEYGLSDLKESNIKEQKININEWGTEPTMGGSHEEATGPSEEYEQTQALVIYRYPR